MVMYEKKGNLFELDENKYKFVHCISSDYQMGAGIAVEFQKRYGLRNKLQRIGDNTYPTCLFVNNVFNLVTKDKYWHKPTYDTLTKSLECMRDIILKSNEEGNEIKYLAMPKIASGLDRLQWGRVREIIEYVFKGIDIEIQVRYL